MNSALTFLVVLGFAGFGIAAKDYVRGCFYTNWSQHRTGVWQFMPENIPTGLCTHIFYAFVSMDNEFKLMPIEKNDEDVNGKPGLFNRVNMIKTKQPGLKTLLSFGGYLFGQENADLMRRMLMDDKGKNRETFILSVISYVRHWNFDGFDFNWYPDVATRDVFAVLIKELHQAFESEAKIGNQERLLLTVAVPPMVERIEAGFDGKKLAEHVDWMNVMAFDYHGAWENKTGFNTPLYNTDDDKSIKSTFTYLINKQMIPSSKLVLGFAAYGRGWTVSKSADANSLSIPATGPSPSQPFTDAAGVASYFEICELIEKSNFVVGMNKDAQKPFIFKDGVWYSYDDVKSFNAQLDFLIKMDVRGAFQWNLDMDDYLGRCSSGPYPLLKTFKAKLMSE